MGWSRSRQLPLDQVRAWFGESVHAEIHEHPSYRRTARLILIGLMVVNAIPLLLATGSTFFFVIIAALAIYLPALILDKMD
jgi:hypothetical protein